MTQEREPAEQLEDDSQPQVAQPSQSADQPDPALQSVLQEADRPDVSLISKITNALKSGQPRGPDASGPSR